MKLDIDTIAGLSPPLIRGAIVPWLQAHVALDDGAGLAADVQAVVDAADDAQLGRTLGAFAACGEAYQLYPADPVARGISRAFMPHLLPQASVRGLEHLAACAGPTLLLSNHLSYTDTQVLDVLLAASGHADFADRLVAVAGPKVYSEAFRRLASLSLNTYKTAQPSQLGHNEAALSPREVGRIAIETVRACQALMAQGTPVVIYAEGSRSRSGRLQPFFKGVSKYARGTGTVIVPVATWGTEAVFPLEGPPMRPARVGLAIGEPVAVEARPVEAVAACWRRIADLLPAAYQPDPETPPVV